MEERERETARPCHPINRQRERGRGRGEGEEREREREEETAPVCMLAERVEEGRVIESIPLLFSSIYNPLRGRMTTYRDDIQ